MILTSLLIMWAFLLFLCLLDLMDKFELGESMRVIVIVNLITVTCTLAVLDAINKLAGV